MGTYSEIEPEYRAIDEAINEYVKATTVPGAFVTGFFVVASMSSPEHDVGNNDGYVTIPSDGLPYHSQIGLLHLALQDKQNAGFSGFLNSIMGNFIDDDDDDEEEY